MYSTLIRKIKNELGITTPIDFNSLVDKFSDIEIRYGQTIGDEEGLVVKEEDKYIIKIKTTENQLSNRDRFTIAHELGHVFLNHIDNYEVLYRNGNNEIEYEANEFAAELLMSEEEFREAVNDATVNGVCDLKKVSKKFEVSESAVLTRGRFLGVFPW